MTTPSSNLVWFRHDLRVHDNPALSEACTNGASVFAIYILDDETPGVRAPGAASRWWLHHSLRQLVGDLAGLGIQLILKRGDAASVLAHTAEAVAAAKVYWNRRYDPGGIACDTAIKASLREAGVEAESSAANLLCEPFDVRTGQGSPYRVFTPFWKALRSLVSDAPPLPAPEPVADPLPSNHAYSVLDDWTLLPTHPNWAGGFDEVWTPGEAAARIKLRQFLNTALEGYGAGRDIPALAATSLLSPHLCFGEISPRSIWHAVRHHLGGNGQRREDGEKFLSELGWREFSHHLMFHYPAMVSDNYNDRFDRFDWRDDEAALHLWQRGMTGYPIVDAGMRELWSTGYMHNRVRMITASFLTKHLRIHWAQGEAWFWDTLVDADIANNVANWQWVAGTGADAAPYFRIFNPMLQGEKFDPRGEYVRKWVPELGAIPDRYLHKPWQAPGDVLASAGVSLGTTYPCPIVDHRSAREAALDAFRALKGD